MLRACWFIASTIGIGIGPVDLPEIEISTIVAGLSAPRRADRDRAAIRIEAAGEAAVPALLKAAGSTDLELRLRAAALLDAIEGRTLARPTLVTLDFRDRPITEVVDAIADRTGLGLILDVQGDPRRGDQRITLESTAPVPFWEALDRLGKVAGLRPNTNPNPGWNGGGGFGGGGGGFNRGMGPNRFGIPGAPRRPTTGQEVALTPDFGPGPMPTVRSGRFEIGLVNLHLQRDRVLGGPGGRRPREIATDRFEARLRVWPEPGLSVGKVGEIEVLEAEDDRGQSLIGPPPAPDASSMYEQNVGGASITPIRLRYPDNPGTLIRRLKGRFRVTVVGPRPDPLVTSTVSGLGSAVRKRGESIIVHSMAEVPGTGGGKARLVDMMLSRRELAGANGLGGMSGLVPNPTTNQPPGASQAWFEFVDDRGRLVDRVTVQGMGVGNGTIVSDVTRRSVRVSQPDGVGPPVSVRYVAMTWATLTIPFEFLDLPMP